MRKIIVTFIVALLSIITAWAQDTTPPALITTLSALTGSGSGEVDLSWIAPGDDGTTGGADHYSIRYDTFSFPVEYCDTFEYSNLDNWSTDAPYGGDVWYVSSTTAYEGHFSARAGSIGASQVSVIERTVEGPFTLKFLWKVSSQKDYDYLMFYIDDEHKDDISGYIGWNEKTYFIPAGNHKISWEYYKNSDGISMGEDTGWIDNVFADWWDNASVWKDNISTGGAAGFQETDTVTGLPLSSKLYYFSIKAYDDENNWGGFSNLGSASPPDLTPPQKITDLTASTGLSDREINLSWTAPGDDNYEGELQDAKYRIQVSSYGVIWSTSDAQIEISTTSVNPGDKQAHTVTGLEPGTTYFLRIWTADEVSNYSPISIGTTIWAQIDIPPAAVTDLVSTQGVFEGEILLRWTATGDDVKERDITGGEYEIRWSNIETEGWDDMTSIKWTTNTQTGSLNSKVITGLDSGTTYYFYLKIRDEYENNWSDLSNKTTNWAAVDLIPPGDIDNLSSKRGIYEGEVTLSWNAPGDNGMQGQLQNSKFKIQNSTWTDVIWSTTNAQITISTSNIAQGEGQAYTVTGLTGGTTYYFRIWTADEVPLWSGISNKTTCWAQIDIVPPGAITSLSVSPGDYEGEVDLSWIAPGDNDIINGSANYYEIRYSFDSFSTEVCDSFEYGVLNMWNTYGNANWYVDDSPGRAHSGSHCVRAGSIGASQESVIERTVEGPFTLTFWWKVSSQENHDRLMFYIDDAHQDDITGSVDWTQGAFPILPGPHTIKWEYYKDSDEVSMGEDTGWIDDISSSAETWWDSAAVWKSALSAGGPAGFNEVETVAGLNSGATYYFCIRSCDENLNWSLYSSSASGWAQVDFIPPSGISNLTALTSQNEGEIILTWTAPGDSGTTGTVTDYLVKYSDVDTVTHDGFNTAATYYHTWSTATFASGGNTETQLVTGLNCGATYWFAVVGYDECNNYGIWNSSKDFSEVNTECSAWVQKIPPAAVTNLSAETGLYECEVVLTWTAPGDDGTTDEITGGKYEIKCSSVETHSWDDMTYSLSWTMDTSPGTSEERTIGGLEPGNTYYFYIKTQDENTNNWSSLSNKTTASAHVLVPPAAVTDLESSQGSRTGYILLRWHAPGDDGWDLNINGGKYEIRYSPNAGHNWDVMPSSLTWNVNTYPDKFESIEITGLSQGTTYYFYIKTQDENENNWSDLSNKTSTWASVDTGPPADIQDLTADRTGCIEGQVRLTWTAPGDDEMEGDIYGGRYHIKYSSIPTGEFDVASYQIEWSTDTVPGRKESTIVTDYIEGGTTYYFWIKTRDEIIINWSDVSNKTTCWAQVDVTSPAAIGNLSGSRTGLVEGQLRLSWTATGDDDYSGYVSGGEWTIAHTTDSAKTYDTAENIIPPWTTSYAQLTTHSRVFSNLLPGVTYYAWIRASDEAGNWSEVSNKMTAWAQVDATEPSPVTDLATAQGQIEGELILFWSAPGNDGTTGNIENGKYWIRHTTTVTHTWNDTDYEVIWDTTTSFGMYESKAVTGLIPNASYYFWIRTADELMNWSDISNKATGWLVLDSSPLAPTGLSVLLAGDRLITIVWTSNPEFDIDHYDIYCDSTSPEELGDYDFIASTAALSYTHTGLTNANTYWYRIKAVDMEPALESIFSLSVSTWPRPPAPDAALNFEGVVLSTESIHWSWYDVDTEDNYYVMCATGGPASSGLGEGTTDYVEHGLLPNTEYKRRVLSVNLGGGSLSQWATAYTYANPPRNLTGLSETMESVSLSWNHCEGGGNTAFDLQRSTDGEHFFTIEDAEGWKNWAWAFDKTAYIDTGWDLPGETLVQKTTYWYQIRGYNYDAISTSFTESIAVRTLAMIPEPVRGLEAAPIGEGRIQLTWKISISTDVTEYRIYYSSGEIDYETVRHTVSPSAEVWTSGEDELESDVMYRFVVRAVNTYENDDENTNEVTMVALGSLAGIVKAKIGVIENGMRIYGDKVTVMADSLVGNISDDIKSVAFKYKPASSGSWSTIGTDTEYPFIVSWDVTQLSGQYNLSAVATDPEDSTPGYITVIVDSMKPDIEEITFSGGLRKREKIYNDMDNIIMVGQAGNNNFTKLTVPEGSLNVQITMISITVNAADVPEHREDLSSAGEYREIVLENGQTELIDEKMATLIIPYVDEDNDDKVDSTAVGVESLEIYRYMSITERWQKEPSSTGPDTVEKTCTVTINKLSVFGIFGGVVTDIRDAHPYPNPFKPNSELGHTGITFTELTNSVRIRVVSIAGDLVFDRKLNDTGGVYSWDAANNAGKPLASGVYFYLITGEGRTKTGKLSIIR